MLKKEKKKIKKTNKKPQKKRHNHKKTYLYHHGCLVNGNRYGRDARTHKQLQRKGYGKKAQTIGQDGDQQ